MDRQEIKFLLNFLEDNRKHINPLQYAFVTSLRRQFNDTAVLTQKQIESLFDIKELIQPPSMAENILEQESYRAQYSSFDHLSQHNI
jgi:hypothetical protein